MFLVVPMFVHIGAECSLDGEFGQWLAQGSGNLFGLDVFGLPAVSALSFSWTICWLTKVSFWKS